jgi:hypothetical protein
MKKMKFGILLAFAVIVLVSVASALPSSTTASVNVQSGPSYFKITTATGDSELMAGPYDGWCSGFDIHGIGDQTKPYNVYDSRGDLSALPLYITTTNWNKVNWIINNPNPDWKITQAAIWKVDGGSGVDYPSDTYTLGYSETEFLAYMELVKEQGGFVPTTGQYYAAVFDKEYEKDGKIVIGQPVIIPVFIPPINTPEFPTLALPMAMLIGVVGVVEYFRVKKE